MTNQDIDAFRSAPTSRNASRFGYYAAILTAVLTVVTFGFAINAIPISGANCAGDCIDYPYLDTVGQFPKDFIWMPPAMMLVLAYVALMVSIHAQAPSENKIFSQAGLALALMAAVVLLIDYFVQFSVVPVSLMNNETEGLPLLIQYNSHGVFIALEELGYILMALSFLAMAPVFGRSSRVESAIRWIFVAAFFLALVSLAATSITRGLERQDRFEIAVISIDWLVLLINGVLLAIMFRRRMRQAASHDH